MPNGMKYQIEITAAQRELFLKTFDGMAHKGGRNWPVLSLGFLDTCVKISGSVT